MLFRKRKSPEKMAEKIEAIKRWAKAEFEYAVSPGYFIYKTAREAKDEGRGKKPNKIEAIIEVLRAEIEYSMSPGYFIYKTLRGLKDD